VQAALCVRPTGRAAALFEYGVCAKIEEVRAASRSCYYPVELSEVIRHVLSHEGQYAVTALPCYAKALRRAMEVSPRLRDRITCILGLVCGQSKTRFFSEYLCALAGGDPKRMRQVTFRLKMPGRSARDACTSFVVEDDDGGSRELAIYNSQWAPNTLWTDGYFTPNPCFFCDDVFAECADVAFMDAWLPSYEADWRGYSISLIRDPGVATLFRNGREQGSLAVQPLSIAQVIDSQRPAIVLKRSGIAERVRFAAARGQRVPTKRKALYGKYMLGRLERALVRCRWLISQKSGQQWLLSQGSVADFRRRMRPLEAKARILRRLLLALWNPSKLPGIVMERLVRLFRARGRRGSPR
jgi:coenzyme F420-reducing hydrogenase beta subunit